MSTIMMRVIEGKSGKRRLLVAGELTLRQAQGERYSEIVPLLHRVQPVK